MVLYNYALLVPAVPEVSCEKAGYLLFRLLLFGAACHHHDHRDGRRKSASLVPSFLQRRFSVITDVICSQCSRPAVDSDTDICLGCGFNHDACQRPEPRPNPNRDVPLSQDPDFYEVWMG